MAGILRCLVAALAALALEASAQADANLQNLLNGLTSGSEITLVTRLSNGMTEVTSFTPPVRLSAAEAAGAIERARHELAALGVAQPSGQQLALALVGGTVDIPSGRTQLGGVLPQGPQRAQIRSQIVAAGALPSAPAQAGAQAGSLPLTHAEIAQAMTLAAQQLAQHGIANPTPEQLRTAMFGGVITPPSGPLIQLPGVMPQAGGSAAVGGSPPQPLSRPVVPSR
jgi:hypothetical protein